MHRSTKTKMGQGHIANIRHTEQQTGTLFVKSLSPRRYGKTQSLDYLM